MNISNFFSSSAGMYIVQAFLHAFVAAIIVDRALRIWDIRSPRLKQRFRFLVIVLPIVSFPLYQVINPDRNTLSFRLEALLDSNGWVSLELWKTIPLGLFPILVFFITTLIFILQEALPILKHTFGSNRAAPDVKRPEEDSPVNKALAGLPVERPEVFLLDDDTPLLFSATGRIPAIFISSGLMNAFTIEQIQAAAAHEIAHIIRSKRPLLIAIFFLRVLMFFNPVVLLEFRRIVQEEEKVCDDFALSLTRNPGALADVLKYLRHADAGPGAKGGKFSGMVTAIEEYSHRSLLESRIARIEKGIAYEADDGWFEFAVTLGAILLINYFVV